MFFEKKKRVARKKFLHRIEKSVNFVARLISQTKKTKIEIVL